MIVLFSVCVRFSRDEQTDSGWMHRHNVGFLHQDILGPLDQCQCAFNAQSSCGFETKEMKIW